MSETERRTTTRRAMMGNASMAALAGIAGVAIVMPGAQAVEVLPASVVGDAALLTIEREAVTLIERRKPLEARWWAVSNEPNKWTTAVAAEAQAVADALEPIDDRLEELIDRALELSATTREGMVAKARLIRREMRLHHSSYGVMEFDAMDPDERLAWSLAEDLLGVEVVQ